MILEYERMIALGYIILLKLANVKQRKCFQALVFTSGFINFPAYDQDIQICSSEIFNPTGTFSRAFRKNRRIINILFTCKQLQIIFIASRRC